MFGVSSLFYCVLSIGRVSFSHWGIPAPRPHAVTPTRRHADTRDLSAPLPNLSPAPRISLFWGDLRQKLYVRPLQPAGRTPSLLQFCPEILTRRPDCSMTP